jgi:hypothetical protein
MVDTARTILVHLPPSLAETDEQTLALAEAQALATLAVAEALASIDDRLLSLLQTIDPDRGR